MCNTSTLNYNNTISIGYGGAEIIILLFVYSLIVVFYKNDDDGSDVKIKQQRKSDLIYIFIYMTKDNL